MDIGKSYRRWRDKWKKDTEGVNSLFFKSYSTSEQKLDWFFKSHSNCPSKDNRCLNNIFVNNEPLLIDKKRYRQQEKKKEYELLIEFFIFKIQVSIRLIKTSYVFQGKIYIHTENQMVTTQI